ncbi:MAG TPA: hypothetical protein VHX52_06130 [Steroidobacteraceae bacterium]|jgi:hypothetical protein|nr:hypothetical protein [Steroidobacteraceae bacterium]
MAIFEKSTQPGRIKGTSQELRATGVAAELCTVRAFRPARLLERPGEPAAAAAERVRGLIGSLESGIEDLAEQHRAYIIESLTRAR